MDREKLPAALHTLFDAIGLLDFASSYLGADFIFWGIQEPYFSEDVVPTIARSGRH